MQTGTYQGYTAEGYPVTIYVVEYNGRPAVEMYDYAAVVTCSRRMSASAEPKMIAAPAMLPKIGWSLSQKGNAISSPATAGTVPPRMIQCQLSPFTTRSL